MINKKTRVVIPKIAEWILIEPKSCGIFIKAWIVEGLVIPPKSTGVCRIIIINPIPLKNPEITENYIGLWKSHWHEENKAWLYPAKQYAIYAEVSLACLSAWIAASKAKFWK